jgi:hypothetical protein
MRNAGTDGEWRVGTLHLMAVLVATEKRCGYFCYQLPT